MDVGDSLEFALLHMKQLNLFQKWLMENLKGGKDEKVEDSENGQEGNKERNAI